MCLTLLPGISAATQAVLALELESPRPLVSPLVGFNTPLAMAKYTGGRYTHEAFIELARAFSCRVIRFPGGTVANFFDWAQGYVSPRFVQEVGKKKMIAFVDRDLQRTGGRMTRLDIRDFLKAAETLDARPFVVLNMFMYDASALKDIVDSIKKFSRAPIHWELGNEVSQEEYADDYRIPGGWNANVYIARAQALIDHINVRYPEDEVGIVASQMVEGRHPRAEGLRHIERRREKWDARVASLRGYDAVIIHPYILAFEDRGGGDVAPSKGWPPPPWRWVFASAQNVPEKFMTRLRKRFGDSKVWLTEAGLVERGGAATNARRAQPMYRALFQVVNFISWSQFYPRMHAYLYHGLFKGNGQHAVVYPDGSLTANGVGLAIIAWLMEGADQILPVARVHFSAFPGMGAYAAKDVDAVMGLATQVAKGEQRLVLVNMGGRPTRVRLPWVPERYATVSWGRDQLIEPGAFWKADLNTWQQGSDGEIALPPYSITRVVAD